MLRFLGCGGKTEKVSHVRVSGVWKDQGNGVTCYSFWDLGEWGKRCHMLRFLGFGWTREMVSHVTVSAVWEGREKVSHVTVSGDWNDNVRVCTTFYVTKRHKTIY